MDNPSPLFLYVLIAFSMLSIYPLVLINDPELV